MSHDETVTRYLQPYSSASPSSSDTQSSNSNRGNGSGPFDPGNTPPLVFAFIAVGFIVFGLVIAVIYKKCRPLPDSLEPHYQRSSVPVRRPSVQKPKLWDVWTAPSQRVPDEQRTNNVNDWDTLVPLSASLVYPYSPSPLVRVPQQYVQGRVARPTLWENPEHRLFFRRPPTDTSLHVAVTISMPKPPQHQGSMPNRTHTEDEFHVGVTEVKWTG
ncbi:hypothetical protein BDM02DRAFT_3129627 [Thelephora ganbajun]|uniref:Uncharacterized protein n=1 Tax=Thelephora ganbajun TaxID=370292 RepID=A0ACB6ZDL6_THEGA|nr:hypothetical protein BDM02DRAFT_3129627 [Thelephora ganbajun]